MWSVASFAALPSFLSYLAPVLMTADDNIQSIHRTSCNTLKYWLFQHTGHSVIHIRTQSNVLNTDKSTHRGEETVANNVTAQVSHSHPPLIHQRGNHTPAISHPRNAKINTNKINKKLIWCVCPVRLQARYSCHPKHTLQTKVNALAHRDQRCMFRVCSGNYPRAPGCWSTGTGTKLWRLRSMITVWQVCSFIWITVFF